jgi:hypothetical protein
MEPLELVEAFGAAWATRDLDAAISFLSDDCVFDATGPAPDGARHVGPSEIRQAWKAIFDDPSSNFEPEEAFGSGDRVIQRWRYSWADGCHLPVTWDHLRGGFASDMGPPPLPVMGPP